MELRTYYDSLGFRMQSAERCTANRCDTCHTVYHPLTEPNRFTTDLVPQKKKQWKPILDTKNPRLQLQLLVNTMSPSNLSLQQSKKAAPDEDNRHEADGSVAGNACSTRTITKFFSNKLAKRMTATTQVRILSVINSWKKRKCTNEINRENHELS